MLTAMVCTGSFVTAAGSQETPELTIWVDSDSEYIVRMALSDYVGGSESNVGTKYEAEFPEVSWNLVDKSYLSAEQYQAELEAELASGSGPDLIFMDQANGIDPVSLMESSYLMELEGMTERYLRMNPSYLPGTLQAGQKDGKQYILPLSIQCPVVFGLQGELTEAGLNTEEYGDLKNFAEALLAAAEKSGKLVFEDRAAVDWLEQNCLPQGLTEETEEVKELRELLGRIRKLSGDADCFWGPYEALSSGEALLGGSGFLAKSKTAQNFALFEEDEVAFLSVPSWDGEIRAVITQSVAVNANTVWPAEARAVLRAFQGFSANRPCVMSDLPAAGGREYWKSQLVYTSDLAEEALQPDYAERARKITSSSKISKEFQECTQKAVTDAVFCGTSDKAAAASEQEQLKDTETDGRAVTDEAVIQKEMRVLTVAFDDLGMGEEHPVYQWMQNTAETYSGEEIWVQLVPLSSGTVGVSTQAHFMQRASAGIDIILTTNYLDTLLASWYTELTPLAEGRENLEIVDVDGKPRGLMYGILEEKELEYVFVISQKSEMIEEAFEFCVKALENEVYAETMQKIGYCSHVCRNGSRLTSNDASRCTEIAFHAISRRKTRDSGAKPHLNTSRNSYPV
ncbi:MAG: extracellular solute-binding protein, partial [Lachnospiraceae bacterium]|nr:extracellular solute-binding protein [Lachnospiraceae bacterium]